MTHVRRELLEADDTTIEDAVRYADRWSATGHADRRSTGTVS
jgi:hypothetical protein